jgi:hypothetical protein
MNSTKTSPQKDLKQLTLHTYGKRGARQSKRLRDVRTHGARTERHKVAIWPSMDVKALKLEVRLGCLHDAAQSNHIPRRLRKGWT